ncbi:MAG: hypothetical protein KC978_06710, partial [Candidatus Omnitrophica bacterium]|nr:hypothetical protein [Candidatus Omnitrophota bacterium]
MRIVDGWLKQGLFNLFRGMAPGIFLVLSCAHCYSQPTESVLSFQDGSLSASGDSFDFAYFPFLSTLPVWAPALPQYYGQPVEPVRPLPGLGGPLRIGFNGVDGGLEPLHLKRVETSSEPWQFQLVSASSDTVILAHTSPDRRGVTFDVEGNDLKSRAISFEITASPQDLTWCKPGKKERQDWGTPSWEWDSDLNTVIQTYSSPLDATRSMTTGLWFSKDVQPKVNIEADPTGVEDARIRIDLVKIPNGFFRFGFVHADNEVSLKGAVEEARLTESEKSNGAWSEWLDACHEQIARAMVVQTSREFRPSEEDKALLDRELVQARQLFLSNGMVLNRPMTGGELPYSLKKQGIALKFWRDLGLEYPFREQWRDLVRFHPAIERTIPITPFSGDGIREVLQSSPIVVTAPDPEDPPTKAAFDILLGYVIDGGNVTLVDGYSGFQDKKGWWTDAGAADPADYALRVLGAPIDYDSRKVLDEEGMAPDRNTFSLGMSPVDSTSASDEKDKTRVTVGGEGFLFICAKNSSDPEGLILRGGKIGEKEFRSLTASEEEILAASHQPELAWSAKGEPVGRRLRGEGFAVYRLPSDSSVTCELDVTGDPAFYVGSSTPETDNLLLKKVVQAWYHRALLTFPVSRSAHPVVYDGTYTCRVFDVTGTEVSPVLFHKVGRGSFAWVGLPADYLRLGSDRGTDLQTNLREDPGYDLIRMTLALHDPRQAGAQQAGATPRWAWTDQLNVRGEKDPDPETIFYAWESIRQLGAGAGNSTFWGWALTAFTKALRDGQWAGERLENSPL